MQTSVMTKACESLLGMSAADTGPLLKGNSFCGAASKLGQNTTRKDGDKG